MITKFEKYININKPDVNSVSPEFWDVVDLIDWGSVIKYYNENPTITEGDDLYEDRIKFKLYIKFEYDEIKKFSEEFHKFYTELYSYFSEYFEQNDDDFQYSDEFGDNIMSMIGKGKKYTEYYINNPKRIKSIDSIEGFQYLFDVTEEEYWEIKAKYDPLYKDMRRFNV